MAQVLFVDDDLLTLQLMTRVATILGHEVVAIASPIEALIVLEMQPPQMIIVDMQMAEMNGIQFIQNAHTSAIGKTIPIIVLSAERDGREEREAREAGAVAYYTKPIGFDELQSIIETYATV
ncbi:MAG TPA: response regulator [Longilinea sp.]|nr:response regulator [Longilinea sp.]